MLKSGWSILNVVSWKKKTNKPQTKMSQNSCLYIIMLLYIQGKESFTNNIQRVRIKERYHKKALSKTSEKIENRWRDSSELENIFDIS